MLVDFSNNYFELFEFDVQFEIDIEQLDAGYQSLQRVLHPDKFASASDNERRWSMQAAGFVNEAYQTLSKPLSRATYLLKLNGISIDEETDTHMSPMFLMEQMELRESLADVAQSADPYAAVESVRKQLTSSIEKTSQAFLQSSTEQKWDAARSVVREWQFLEKLKQESRVIEARLDDDA